MIPCGVGWGLQLGLKCSPTSPPSPTQPITSLSRRHDAKSTFSSTSHMLLSVSEFSFWGTQPVTVGIENGPRKQMLRSLELGHLPLAGNEKPISGSGWSTDNPWLKEAGHY